jgi:beta-lactamase class A
VGLSLFADEATMSGRDLLVLMLTISDNVATDALIDLIGVDQLNAAARRVGMTSTDVPSDLCSLLDQVASSAGFTTYAEIDARGDRSDPDRGDRTATPPSPGARSGHWRADHCTRHDHLAPGDLAGRGRTGSGLRTRPVPDGTPAVASTDRERVRAGRGHRRQEWCPPRRGRNEVGVVTLPSGQSYAVAVFTRTPEGDADPRHIDAAVGQAAAIAVEALRG